MKTYGYARVSTAGQAEEGVSMSAQAAAIKSYCETYGLDLVEIIEDAGESAATLRRPGMERLLALVDEGEVGAIVVYQIDRLSRSLRDLFSLLPELDAKKVQFHSVIEKIDTKSAFGRAMLGFIGLFSQFTREQTAERTAFALAHIKDKNGGRQINGMPPYGRQWKEGVLVPMDIEERAVAAIKSWADIGQTVLEITCKLNEKPAYQTRGGGPWHRAQVWRILRQENGGLDPSA